MISLKELSNLTKVLPRCSVANSAGDMLLVDRNGEIVGEIDLNKKGITVYREYSHSKVVSSRLKKASFPVKLKKAATMSSAMKILYDQPKSNTSTP